MEGSHEGTEIEAEKIRQSDSKVLSFTEIFFFCPKIQIRKLIQTFTYYVLQKVRFKAEAIITPQRLNLSKHQEPKHRTSPLESNAIQRLENLQEN